MARVGIYTRLSVDRDGTQTATARQEADCRALAEREGWEVVDVYTDTDLSGSRRGVVRPAYERLLADLRARRIDTILVWKLDRLSRQPRQFEAVVDACQDARARVVSVNDPADMTSPSGLAMLRVGLAFASLETDTMALRIRRQRAEAADSGRPNVGGLRAFGYATSKTEIVPEEAALVREAAERVLAGEPLGAVARDWNARGITTTRGNAWMVTSLRRMLTNPLLAGRRVHRGRMIASEQIPPILDDGTHERLRALLGARGRGVRSVASRRLSGLVFCGRCGMAMHAHTMKGRGPNYRCAAPPGRHACGAMRIVADPLEALVGEAIATVLDSGDLATAIDRRDPEAERLAAELVELRASRDQLAIDHYSARVLGRSAFLAADADLGRRIERLEADLRRRRRLDVLDTLGPGESVRNAWTSRPPAWGRELAGTLIERVEIAPAPNRGATRLDPARVGIRWRTE